MDTKTQGSRDLQFLLSEGNGGISRDTVTFAEDNGVIEPGTLVAVLDADGTYVPADEAGADGAEVVVAVTAYRVDTVGADVEAVIVSRLAEVITDSLVFPASYDDDPKKAAAVAELAAKHIIAR